MATLLHKMGVADPRTLAQAVDQAIRPKLMGKAAAGTTDADLVAGVVLGAVAVLLVVRGAMGYYIGKQFNRPKAGAAAGAIFGAPGVGAVALFGKGDK